MRLYLCVFLLAIPAYGQYAASTSGSTTAAAEVNSKLAWQSGTVDPATCIAGKDTFWNSTSLVWKVCTATNTWTQMSQVVRTVSFTDVSPVIGDSGIITVLNPGTAVHLTRVYCTIQGATNVVMNLDKRTEAAIGTDSTHHLLGADLAAISTGASTSTFANGSGQCGGTTSCAVAAHSPVLVTITSVSGTPTLLYCSIDYTVDVN